MQLRNILVAAALASVGTVAAAKAAKEPNCEVSGKKVHVKDEKACTKKKGTWTATGAAAAPAAATSEPAAAPAAEGAAPAEGATAK